VNVLSQQPPPAPFANLAVHHRAFPLPHRPDPYPVKQTPSLGRMDGRPGQANTGYSDVHLHGEVCVHDNVHVAFHFLLPPSPYFFSLPLAFGYSSNRFSLCQTANDDNEKDCHHNNNCCNISLGYLVMRTARASTLFLHSHGATISFLYYTSSLHCSTRWGCFSADTGLTEH